MLEKITPEGDNMNDIKEIIDEIFKSKAFR